MKVERKSRRGRVVILRVCKEYLGIAFLIDYADFCVPQVARARESLLWAGAGALHVGLLSLLATTLSLLRSKWPLFCRYVARSCFL